MASVVERVLTSLANQGQRASLLSNETQIIKDKIGRRNEVGFLSDTNLNDVFKATEEMRSAFSQNVRQMDELQTQIRGINPRVVLTDEEDPFI